MSKSQALCIAYSRVITRTETVPMAWSVDSSSSPIVVEQLDHDHIWIVADPTFMILSLSIDDVVPRFQILDLEGDFNYVYTKER